MSNSEEGIYVLFLVVFMITILILSFKINIAPTLVSKQSQVVYIKEMWTSHVKEGYYKLAPVKFVEDNK